jgi:glycosyltransferase involved in cell wall biosynthesis
MAHIIKKSGYDVIYDIIGGDIMQEPREALLKAKAKTLDLTDNVIFHGQVTSVKQLLENCDIVVCASHEEAFPISILEAMACGKAIVSTDVNGIPEAIVNRKSGMLVPAQSPEKLAEKVMELLSNKSLRTQLASNARERVCQQFSENVFQDKIVALYKALL